MNKVFLYVSNVTIAGFRIPKAAVGIYHYHPDDSYLKNLLVVLDCFGNAVSGGDPDETISSRCAKAMIYEQSKGNYGGGCRMCSFLATFQQNHCQIALERNKGARAVIPDAGE